MSTTSDNKNLKVIHKSIKPIKAQPTSKPRTHYTCILCHGIMMMTPDGFVCDNCGVGGDVIGIF